MNTLSYLLSFLFRGNLVLRIAIGLILGLIVAVISPDLAKTSLFDGFNIAESVGILGKIFVHALRSVAPILVFILVTAAIANRTISASVGRFKSIALLYFIGTFFAALTAVVVSFMFPSEITLVSSGDTVTAPKGVAEVLTNLVFNMVDNPISAIANANFIGILTWAIALGIGLQHSSSSTKTLTQDLAYAISKIVHLVIQLAPIGIFGLVASILVSSGSETSDLLSELKKYGHLLTALLGTMLFVALVINPIIVFWKTRRNPFPLVFTCLRESGVTAFFTRSSAANIPVNLALAKRLKLNEELYSVSIPLGATINMAGAAVTITILTLAAVNSLNIEVSIGTALLLSVVASLCACGASGVAGGSLLLIPLSCSLFGIPNEIASQVIAVGFAISILQDSTETALNSSTDVVFTAAVSMSEEKNSA